MKTKLKYTALLLAAICAMAFGGCREQPSNINRLCAEAAGFGYMCAERGMSREEMLVELEKVIGPLE